MPLLTLKNIYYSVGQFPLLDYVNLDINEKERIALIGRNGEGKSTFLNIIGQIITPEAGEFIKSGTLKIAKLPQELPPLEEITVYEAVARGLQELSDVLVEYHHLISQVDGHDDAWMHKLTIAQQMIETNNGWQIQQRIDRIIQDLKLPQDKKMSQLSGGWRRRVTLAQALVQEPDILLLDEPTNHLDLEAIQWLETMLVNYPKTIIFITHDRALLRKVATKIIELDRGKLTEYPSDYDTYLKRKEQFLMEEERHNALFDKKLSEEEQWIRQGVKARRTRNEGRVRALEALREERAQRRIRKDKPNIELNDPSQSGKMVIQAENVSFGYPNRGLLIRDFTFNIQRGDKIAIVGPNGLGKTTLIKLLIGTLTPTHGTIKLSPTNKVAFFDQNRDHLNKEDTVMGNVAEGDDFVEIQGKRKHVIGYLGDFLFSPNKCRSSAATLSGGEQNRLLLARLFARPANILVLDEPTNDLDIESLAVLEEVLLNYSGTVIIISHDREFVDNIATHCISMEGHGKIAVNVGGYTDWLHRKEATPVHKNEGRDSKGGSREKPRAETKNKLTFNEQQELKKLMGDIDSFENEIKAIEAKMADPKFHQNPKDDIVKVNKQLSQLKTDLNNAYARWEALDEKKS